MDWRSLSRWCYLSSITMITLGLSFDGIFTMMLLEQYLHEKSLEESHCVTINLSLVHREKCVVCEKSRSPAFPCYEHSVFYVLQSAPHLPARAPSVSAVNFSSSSPYPHPHLTTRPATASTSGPASRHTRTITADRTELLLGYIDQANSSIPKTRGPSNISVPVQIVTGTPLPFNHANPALQESAQSSRSEIAKSAIRRQFASRLKVLPEHVHGPVFLYESHYTWTRLHDMRERERDHQNYHPNCAKVECNAEYELNREAIERYVLKYMPKSNPLASEPFACFAGEGADEGGEHAAFMKRTLSGVLMFHLLLWPALSFLVGFIVLFLNLVLMGCDVWRD